MPQEPATPLETRMLWKRAPQNLHRGNHADEYSPIQGGFGTIGIMGTMTDRTPHPQSTGFAVVRRFFFREVQAVRGPQSKCSIWPLSKEPPGDAETRRHIWDNRSHARDPTGFSADGFAPPPRGKKHISSLAHGPSKGYVVDRVVSAPARFHLHQGG